MTSDPGTRANPPETDQILSPQKGILIELKSNDGLRYTTSDPEGRFTFDGLPKGRYEIRGYKSESPDPAALVAGPDEITVDPKVCRCYVALARQS